MLKKAITPIFFLIMVISFTACGKSAGQTGRPAEENHSAPKETGDDTKESADDTVQAEDTGENTGDTVQAEDAEAEEAQEEREEDSIQTQDSDTQAEDETPEAQGGKVLVAYFSATGTTKGVAEQIANGLNADIYEIIPEEPYTEADLDYHDNNSRSTIEMNDSSSRPAISGSVEDMEQYDIVFIGYPIWWGEAPRIVSTFVESYDFSGKTVVPFCTSGGSGVGSSASGLEQLTGGARWLEGHRLSGSESQETVMEWVNGLDLFQS